jgi:hypothetical protein
VSPKRAGFIDLQMSHRGEARLPDLKSPDLFEFCLESLILPVVPYLPGDVSHG